MAEPEILKSEPTRSFSWVVQQIQNGDLHEELGDALREINMALVDHVQEFGGKPKAKLKIAINFHLDKGIFFITADYEVKKPARPAHGSIMYGTPGGNFSVDNQRQLQMFGAGAKPQAVVNE